MRANRNTDRWPCNKERVTVDVWLKRICGSWWAHVPRGGHRGQLPARRLLLGQNPEGSQACDLPVEQATKFEFIINLKAAKQIGLTIPPRVFERANQVIK